MGMTRTDGKCGARENNQEKPKRGQPAQFLLYTLLSVNVKRFLTDEPPGRVPGKMQKGGHDARPILRPGVYGAWPDIRPFKQKAPKGLYYFM